MRKSGHAGWDLGHPRACFDKVAGAVRTRQTAFSGSAGTVGQRRPAARLGAPGVAVTPPGSGGGRAQDRVEGLLRAGGIVAVGLGQGIAARLATRFEGELRKLHDGLKRPRTRKRLDHVWQRIGRIKEKSRGVGAHYVIDVIADDSGKKARAVTWERRPLAGTMITHPGVYCLRTNVEDWDEETLWRTYTALTDVEAVFRSFKSELGLRPIFHQTQKRSDGHLFITVIAYQLVQTIRRRLGEQGERSSWASLRRILEGQQRVTATFRRKDGRTLHVRKATRAEPRPSLPTSVRHRYPEELL